MVEADELACNRAAVEAEFQDSVSLPTSSSTPDGRGGFTESETSPQTMNGLLQRMRSGDEKLYADKLDQRAGYSLKVPYTVPAVQRGDVIVNGVRYEILAGFGGEARSTHTRLMLARHG